MDSERRSTQRAHCEGPADVQKLPAVGETIPGKIENLSEGGCLIELGVEVVLKLNQSVEVSFEVNQMPFRIRAMVRSLQSNTKIGFQFCDMSERARGRLQDLIEELRADRPIAKPLPLGVELRRYTL
jgi:hypothetical protein